MAEPQSKAASVPYACPACGKAHESESFEFMGLRGQTCPNVPPLEFVLIPALNATYSPDGGDLG